MKTDVRQRTRVLKNRVKLPPLGGCYRISSPSSSSSARHEKRPKNRKTSRPQQQQQQQPSSRCPNPNPVPLQSAAGPTTDAASRIVSMKVPDTDGPADPNYLKNRRGFSMPSAEEVLTSANTRHIQDRSEVLRRRAGDRPHERLPPIRRPKKTSRGGDPRGVGLEAPGSPKKPSDAGTPSSSGDVTNDVAADYSKMTLNTTLGAWDFTSNSRSTMMHLVRDHKADIREQQRKKRTKTITSSRVASLNAEIRREKILREKRDKCVQNNINKLRVYNVTLTGREKDSDIGKRDDLLERKISAMRYEDQERNREAFRRVTQWKLDFQQMKHLRAHTPDPGSGSHRSTDIGNTTIADDTDMYDDFGWPRANKYHGVHIRFSEDTRASQLSAGESRRSTRSDSARDDVSMISALSFVANMEIEAKERQEEQRKCFGIRGHRLSPNLSKSEMSRSSSWRSKEVEVIGNI